MKKVNIVKKEQDFENIIKNGVCCKNRFYIIHRIDNNLSFDRYGISVSKKLGNAVFRNKYKRKLRSIIDNYKKVYVNHQDCIIILRKEAIGKKFSVLEEEFTSLMNRNQKGIKNEK